jgi:serine/threonine protein kinase
MKAINKKKINLSNYEPTSRGAKLEEDKKVQQLNEIEMLENMHHPNIVQLHEVINDWSDHNIYLVMQFLSGKSLQDYGEIPSRELRRKWARQLISALQMCHC